MATKKPIVVYNNKLKELAAGDYVSPAIKQVEIDFGSLPVVSNIFTITDSDAISGSFITGQLAYDASTGKDLDEITMDSLEISCGNAITGTFQMFIKSTDGSYLHDKFKINYQIR